MVVVWSLVLSHLAALVHPLTVPEEANPRNRFNQLLQGFGFSSRLADRAGDSQQQEFKEVSSADHPLINSRAASQIPARKNNGPQAAGGSLRGQEAVRGSTSLTPQLEGGRTAAVPLFTPRIQAEREAGRSERGRAEVTADAPAAVVDLPAAAVPVAALSLNSQTGRGLDATRQLTPGTIPFAEESSASTSTRQQTSQGLDLSVPPVRVVRKKRPGAVVVPSDQRVDFVPKIEGLSVGEQQGQNEGQTVPVQQPGRQGQELAAGRQQGQNEGQTVQVQQPGRQGQELAAGRQQGQNEGQASPVQQTGRQGPGRTAVSVAAQDQRRGRDPPGTANVKKITVHKHMAPAVVCIIQYMTHTIVHTWRGWGLSVQRPMMLSSYSAQQRFRNVISKSVHRFGTTAGKMFFTQMAPCFMEIGQISLQKIENIIHTDISVLPFTMCRSNPIRK